MRIFPNGLILKEQTIFENDKLLTVFTASSGIIRCFAKGVKRVKNKNASGLQTLCYSRLTIYEGRDKYIIDEAEPIEIFYGLRSDLGRLALAQYFCELSMHTVPENSPSEDILSLLLNSLYILANDKKPQTMVKAVFEMRFISLSGYMPDIVCCDRCKCYESDTMHFLLQEGKLLCDNCYDGGYDSLPLSRSALSAVRYCILSEPKRIYSFSLTGEALHQFADCAESYVQRHTEHSCKSLDFYRKMQGMG